MQRTSVRVDIDVADSAPLCTLYSCGGDGQWSLVDSEAFGPFETAYDILQWALRRTVPLLGLPLR